MKPNVHIISNIFPKGRKQILMGTIMCNAKHLCKIPQGINLYKINFNVFNVCLCCQKSLVINSSMYVFFSALLAPLKTSLQISSYTALEIINLLISECLEIQISSLNDTLLTRPCSCSIDASKYFTIK